MSQNIYDEPDFFQAYSKLPRSREGLSEAPEWPTLKSMLPPIEEARILDLGCGFGAFARWARKAGARQVVGVDLSERMLAQARARTDDPGITYRQGDMEALHEPDQVFDLVYSSLAFHYVADYQRLSASIRDWLVPGGRLVFSVEHPIFTAPSHPKWQPGHGDSNVWPLDNYLAEGERTTDWITLGVVKYHRTTATYLNALLDQGFELLRIEEWAPDRQHISEHPEWADEVHRPPFLLVAAKLDR